MPLMAPSTWIALGALVVAAGTALYVAFSGPIVAQRVLQELLTRVDAVESRYERAATDWRAHREGLESLLDEMVTTADRAERERRRVAARENREAKRNGSAPDQIDLEDRDSLLRRARELGHGV